MKIPILIKDEEGNPLIECHRQEMIIEYVWSMNILKGPTLESKKEDHVDKHQSHILEEPQELAFVRNLQIQSFHLPTAPMRVATILCFYFIKSSRGWLWMLLFTISIPNLVVALAQVLAVETAKVELMT